MAGFLLPEQSGEHFTQSRLTYDHDTRITLFLLGEFIAAPQANGPETFKRRLYGGIPDLGKPAVTEVLLEWIDLIINEVERGRMVALHLRTRQ